MMKTDVPMLKIAKIICGEEISPRSEELREGIETKQFPFLFQTNRNCSKEEENFKDGTVMKSLTPNNESNLRLVEFQQREIIQLKEQNRDTQKKIENIEREMRSLKRLRILLREKDRRIKELEESVNSLTNPKKSENLTQDSTTTGKVVMSYEYYEAHPPRRTWTNPVPSLASNLEALSILLHKSQPKP